MRALPDDLRETFKTIERRKAGSFAELMKVAGKEVGSDARGEASKEAVFEAKVREYRDANPGKSYSESYDAVAQVETKLFAEVRAEQKGR
jgi:hypothetical protein